MANIRIGEIDLSVVDRGSGKPVLFAHGFPLDHSMWQAQIDDLANDYRVIAPDLRGFGKSSATDGTAGMDLMADDLAALLDALAVREPVVFCGLSMGGYVAWQFALRHRALLAKLILCDTRAIADSPEAAAGRLKTAERVLAEGPGVVANAMLEKLFDPATAIRQPALVEETRQVMLRTSPTGIAAALRGMAARPDVSSRLAEFDLPALLLCGEHDAISPPAEMQGIAQRLPQATFVEIKGAGHMAPLEQPAAVNAAVRQFIRA
jgi:pimeloyl-ACP methyl ester carboxylesterase